MDIYHYSSQTGEFLGQGLADPDPMNEGEFLHPAFSTTTAPPEAEEGKARTWTGSAWEQVADHRGETWWDEAGRPVIVSDLGNPADNGLSSEEPEPEPQLPSIPTPQLITVALLQVIDEEVVTVGVAAGVSFAMRLDTGIIWLFFSQEMADLSYSYTVLPSSGRATVTDRQLSHMEITITEDGNPVDPAELSVQVYRAT